MSPEMGGAADIVAGVVHGEQPSLGAAAAYKRMHAGFEARCWNIRELLTARALGWSGKEVATVFANSPGAMQLLPTKRYPAKWLRIQAEKGVNLLELPESNPYSEIYAIRDKWWRLMTPEWIEPKGKPQPAKILDSVWDFYIERLGLVEKFHDTLGDYYHDTTHSHYGADEDFKAWKNISWQLEKRNTSQYEWPNVPPPEVTTDALIAEYVESNALGKITIRLGAAESNYKLSKPDTPGDGTVPECSGYDSAITGSVRLA